MSSERSMDDTSLDDSSIVIQGLLELSGSYVGDVAPPAATSSAPAVALDRPRDKADAPPWSPANTDDESTVSIGEIGVDEYFHDVPRDNVVGYDATAPSASSDDGGGGGSGSGNGSGSGSGNGSGSGSGNGSGSGSGNGSGSGSGNGSGSGSGNGSGSGSTNDFRGVINAAMLLSQSHTRIMKSPKTNAVVATMHVYSTPKPRAAAVRAMEAISKCCSKRKRRNTAKKDQQQTETSVKEVRRIENAALEDFGVLVPSLLYRNFFFDRQIMRQSQNCLITKLPAKPTIDDFLTDFARKNDAHLGVLGFILETFNTFLFGWCLDFIERLQYKQMIERYPNRPANKIYGIIHFTRFLVYLPKMLKITTENASLFTEAITPFLNGFLDYMDNEELGINFDIHYEHVMPDYYRMSFWSPPSP